MMSRRHRREIILVKYRTLVKLFFVLASRFSNENSELLGLVIKILPLPMLLMKSELFNFQCLLISDVDMLLVFNGC